MLLPQTLTLVQGCPASNAIHLHPGCLDASGCSRNSLYCASWINATRNTAGPTLLLAAQRRGACSNDNLRSIVSGWCTISCIVAQS